MEIRALIAVSQPGPRPPRRKTWPGAAFAEDRGAKEVQPAGLLAPTNAPEGPGSSRLLLHGSLFRHSLTVRSARLPGGFDVSEENGPSTQDLTWHGIKTCFFSLPRRRKRKFPMPRGKPGYRDAFF